MKTIMVCDAIHKVGFEILNREEDIKVIDAVNVPKDKLLEILGEADVAITRSSTEVGEAFLSAAKNLKALVRAGVGVDNVDMDGCSKRGIIAMNVPTANTIAAVELTMAHMLAAARSFPYAHNDLKIDRIWKREKWYGVELFNKTLGIIGFGNIGSRVAIRAAAFGMKIVAYDPYIDPSKVTDMGGVYTRHSSLRLYHDPHAKDQRDDQYDRRGGDRKDERRRAPHKLRSRRSLQRRGAV